MACKFCGNPTKYKCPKCYSEYCSIACFKSPEHVDLDKAQPVKETPKPEEKLQIESSNYEPNQQFENILQDETIQQLLNEKALQVHLSSIIKLFQQLPAMEREDVINLRVNELRKGGEEENVLVEEFIQRFLQLVDKS